VIDAAEASTKRKRVLDSPDPTQVERWQTVVTRRPQTLQEPGNGVGENDVIEESPPDGDNGESEEDMSAILAMLLEQSRAIAEESQSRRRRSSRNSHIQQSQSQSLLRPPDSQQDSYSESLLPPPTQQKSRMLGDASKSFRTLGNITEEQSIMNLPSWSFLLSSLTALNALPPSHGRSAYQSPRVNLLGLIHELELPSTMPVKNRAAGRNAKMEVTKATLTLLDESGASLQVVMWDAYAEEWAGKHLLQGDVVYLEKIALSEYKGQRQGSTVDGSKVQICYRTSARVGGRRTDPALRPDLDLAWDPISQKVQSLVQLAASL